MALLPAPFAGAADNDAGAWLIASFTDRLPSTDGPSRWRYWLEAQARYPDFGSSTNQLLIRPGIGYSFRPALTGMVGYARFRTHTASGTTITENRFWQHLDWRFRQWHGAALSMRVRLEQRDLSTGDDIGHFLRVRLRYVRDITASGDTEFIASIEPFFDLRDTDYGADSGLSQNRLYAGLSWRLTPKTAVEAGYQNQYFFVDAGRDRSIHLAMLFVKSRF